jgi:hypothetical protein
MYYGPDEINKVASDLEKLHANKSDLKMIPSKNRIY